MQVLRGQWGNDEDLVAQETSRSSALGHGLAVAAATASSGRGRIDRAKLAQSLPSLLDTADELKARSSVPRLAMCSRRASRTS
jgi:hypothetical protein